MVKLLKLIKQHLPFLWISIEFLNGLIVSILYGHKIKNAITKTFASDTNTTFQYRKLHQKDLIHLEQLLATQPEGFDRFFKPHRFDIKTLKRLYRNPAFLMLGAFDNERLVGYFFLRFFANGAAFRGKMVDVAYQKRGIAKEMGRLMTDIAFGAGFRLFATISKYNEGSMVSSAAVNKIHIVKHLPDDYVLIEYHKK